MQLHTPLAQVHDQLSAAAALGDERTREIAAGLATAAAPAVRLAVLDALSAAADEITAALLDFPGSPAVTVRLDGDDVDIAVQATQAQAVTAEPAREDSDASARISLRLSESLKSDIDDAAAASGVSVNTWLVRAASAALDPGPFGDGPIGGFPFGGGGPFGGGPPGRGARPNAGARRGNHTNPNQHRITGWING